MSKRTLPKFHRNEMELEWEGKKIVKKPKNPYKEAAKKKKAKYAARKKWIEKTKKRYKRIPKVSKGYSYSKQKTAARDTAKWYHKRDDVF